MFFPKNFCARHLDGRAQEKSSQPCFKNVKDVMEADIIAVENFSRLSKRVERPVGIGDATVAYLHTDMLVARILGKRTAEPEFFRRVFSRRQATSSTNMEEVRHWAKGLTYKCRAACLHPLGPKLQLRVSDSFTQRHGLQNNILMHAVSMRGSRWKLIKPGKDASSVGQVKRIEHLKDVEDLLDAVPGILDPVEKNRGSLERVCLRSKQTTM